MSSDINSFWNKINKPIKMLSPMAGYTDSAFRLLCRELGADVVMTELVSADAIAFGKFKVERIKSKVSGGKLTFNKVTSTKNQSTADLISFFEEERPLVVQLFGKNPANFAKAAKWLSEELKPDGIDINMGCPARKVVGSDHGAALIKNPELACEIVRAVKGNTSLPVSVKTRLGWDNDDQILSFAPALRRAGIDAITIHGRTYKDGFKGSARWENIFKIKEILPELIVIGNGDLGKLPIINYQSSINDQLSISSNENWSSTLRDEPSGSDSNEKMEKGKFLLDGFAIGRATFGQPWIFSKDDVAKEELKKIISRHAKLAFETKGEHGIVEFRKHLLSYIKGFPGAKELRKEAVLVKSLQDINEALSTI